MGAENHRHLLFFEIIGVLFLAIVIFGPVLGFNFPSGNPPAGGGVFVVNSSGNLGIGGTHPNYKLNVVGKINTVGVGAGFCINDDCIDSWPVPGGGGGPTDGWEDLGSVVHLFNDNDWVGVGTTNPFSPLSVEGGISLGNISLIGSWNSRTPRNNINTGTSYLLTLAFSPTHTIGRDGLPVIAFGERSSGTLAVLKCGDLACTDALSTISIFSSLVDTDDEMKIVIGADGFPVVALGRGGGYSQNEAHLIVIKCNDIFCTPSLATISYAQSPALDDDVNQLDMIIGVDGNPFIIYVDDASSGTTNLVAIHCNDSACVTQGIKSLKTQTYFTAHVSVALGINSFPIISYQKLAGGSPGLYVISCLNIACTSDSDIRIAGPFSSPGIIYHDIIIGSDGFPMIVYDSGLLSGEDYFLIAKCTTATCSTYNTYSYAPFVKTKGRTMEITNAPDGLPVIAYLRVLPSFSHATMDIIKCGDFSCDPTKGFFIYESIIPTLRSTQIFFGFALSSSGLPTISYADDISANWEGLSYIQCGSENCIPFWTRR